MTHDTAGAVSEPLSVARRAWWRGVLWIALLVVAELAIISLLYRHNFSFVCRDVAPSAFCAFLSLMVLRTISVAGGLILLLLARPGLLRPFRWHLQRSSLAVSWLAAHIIGLTLLMAPWFFLQDTTDPGLVLLGAAFWVGGLGVASFGLMLTIAPANAWRQAVSDAGLILWVIASIALFTPELAQVFAKVWWLDAISDATFQTVVTLLHMMQMDVVTAPERMMIGGDGFLVLVGRQCSGVEGFMLISLFVLLYLGLFRKDLQFPHAWILLPIGLALSWVLNAVRIAILIWIGAHVSPELAVNGFHSHAGWLMFSVLSLSLIAVSRAFPVFQTVTVEPAVEAAETPPPLLADVNAAQILPFVVFMASALLASTFSETPAVFYPFRALAFAGILFLFRGYLMSLVWRVDKLALAAGGMIGAAWIAVRSETSPVSDPLIDMLAAMSPLVLAIWMVSRLIGTTLLVPVIEELFFRGYLLRRLDRGQVWSKVFAVMLSSAFFAALHSEWLLAGMAGLVFSGLVLRSGRVTDAILAHAAANGMIGVWVLYTHQWSII